MFAELLILFVLNYPLAFCEDVQVTTPLGIIRGTILTSRLGRKIYSFRGIPFAKATINELRFAPPVPYGKWPGIYNATTDGPACPQPPQPGINIKIAEDCLYLNVYSTKLPNCKKNPRRPVIIFFYGGALLAGTSDSSVAGPQYLLDQELVLVTPNYRLGTLGFLAVGKECPGNNGFKDQVLAMKWVQRNIAAFGGDPDSVTIYGFSAGGVSVTAHSVSPMSRGLFHKEIISSGSIFDLLPTEKNQFALAQKQAQLLGCPYDTSKNIVDCLRTKTAEEIANTVKESEEFGDDPILIWSPVIEEDFGQERFLTEHPIKSVIKGRFSKVPVLAGITKDEFANRAFPVIQNKTLLQALDNNFEKYAPICFLYERNTDRSRQISTVLRQFYFGSGPLTDNDASALGQCYADSLIGFAVNRAVELFSKYSKKLTYYYQFAYQTTSPEVYHGADYAYVFYTFISNNSSLDPKIIELMTTIIGSFAKNGKPDLPANLTSEIVWKPYNSLTKEYYLIANESGIRNHMFESRYALFRRLFPIWSYL